MKKKGILNIKKGNQRKRRLSNYFIEQKDDEIIKEMIKNIKLDDKEEFNEESIHYLLWLGQWIITIVVTFLLIDYGILYLLNDIDYWKTWIILGVFIMVSEMK